MKEYALMFAVAFLAATLLPAQSEAVLVALVAEGDHSPWALLGTATLGNSLQLVSGLSGPPLPSCPLVPHQCGKAPQGRRLVP